MFFVTISLSVVRVFIILFITKYYNAYELITNLGVYYHSLKTVRKATGVWYRAWYLYLMVA